MRRTAHVARLLAESGSIALVSLVSPYMADREAAAMLHAEAGLQFIEVFVDAPLQLCQARDPKGLYARARAGELHGMTGVGAPYEAPEHPDLVVRSGEEPVEEAVERVMRLLRSARCIPPTAPTTARAEPERIRASTKRAHGVHAKAARSRVRRRGSRRPAAPNGAAGRTARTL